MGGETAACLGLQVPSSFQRASEVGWRPLAPHFFQGGPFAGRCLSLSLKRAKTREADLCSRCLLRGWDSVISHNREGSKLAQFGFILPFPLLIGVARLVKLLGQVSEDLMHFRVVDDLSRRQEVSRGWTPPKSHSTVPSVLVSPVPSTAALPLTHRPPQQPGRSEPLPEALQDCPLPGVAISLRVRKAIDP